MNFFQEPFIVQAWKIQKKQRKNPKKSDFQSLPRHGQVCRAAFN
jgi:hypothetical protein